MLMALGEPLPKKIFGHPWLLTGDSKMSKSKGNVIYADDLVNLFGQDAVRYIMLHEMPFAQDGHVTYELMIERINSDLANNLGNLVNRTLSMQNKYFNGEIANPEINEPLDDELKTLAMTTVKNVDAHMNELRVADAISDIFNLLARCNKYIDETMPWALAKDPDSISRLATVLYNLLESIRISAVLLEPFLPVTSEKILNQLNTQKRDIESVQTYGQLENGIRVIEKPEILFQRLDEKEVMVKVNAIQEKIAQKREAEAKKKSMIEPSDFEKVDLRVGKVVSCEKHPDSDKLLILKVDLGEGTPRQIVSGIAKSYTAGQMIGKSVVVVANLKPAIIRGIESNGMLLAGKDDKELAVVEVNDLSAGTRVY